MNTNKITVVGLGGGAGKILASMKASGKAGWFSSLFIDTDKKTLESCRDHDIPILAIGDWENSLGCGGNAQKSTQYTKEHLDEIFTEIGETEVLILIATLGGGTGSGAAPVIAREARKRKILTFCFVTKPMAWEGDEKRKCYDKSSQSLFKNADALLEIPTSQLLKTLDTTNLEKSFNALNDIIADCVIGIAELSRSQGNLKIDMAHIREFLNRAECQCFVALGQGKGLQALDAAFNDFIAFPLLDNNNQEKNVLEECHSALLSIVCGPEFSLNDIEKTRQRFKQFLGEKTSIKIGVSNTMKEPTAVQFTLLGLVFKQTSVTEAYEKNVYHNPTTGKNRTVYVEQSLPLQDKDYGYFNGKEHTIEGDIEFDIPTFIRQKIAIDKGE